MARSGVLFGDSDTRKTTAVAHFSHYIYQKTHKKTLLVSMDGGGWAAAQPEIDAGLIKAYRCNTEIPLPTLRKISQGYFPADTSKSKAAETDLRAVDWDEFGGMAVEGVTSISQALMRHLADKGIKTGEEAVNPFLQQVIVEGKMTQEQFAGNSRAHYGFVQNQLYSMIMNFNSLPCEYVLFTGLESRAEEDDRTPVYGPQIAGKKATALIPSWVGDCIHAQGTGVKKQVEVPDPTDPKKTTTIEIVESVVRFYFMSHPDPVTQIRFPAKPRVAPMAIPQLMKKWPGGYFEPGLASGFDDYLHTVDELNLGQKNAVDEWRRKVDEKWGRGQAGSGGQSAGGQVAGAVQAAGTAKLNSTLAESVATVEGKVTAIK